MAAVATRQKAIGWGDANAGTLRAVRSGVCALAHASTREDVQPAASIGRRDFIRAREETT
jgi:hypothetical protein